MRLLALLLLLATTVAGCDRPPPTDPAAVMALLAAPLPAAQAAARVSRGENLYYSSSCSNCHVLQGPTRGAPSLARLYASPATLTDGRQVTRDRAYLVRSLVRPREQVVAGHTQEMSVIYRRMPAADAAALVAFLESLSPPAANAGAAAE